MAGRVKYCHYTSVENARCILSGECFYLSRYSAMNDGAEETWHKGDDNRVFILSLCNSEAMSIPSFYLYGGIDGKGCRIELTEARIKRIMETGVVSYVNQKGRKLKQIVPRSDYDVYCDWVYYIASNGYCEHHGEKEMRYADREEALSKLRAENRHFFVKSPVWNYEKEYRMAVVFKKPVPYDRIALQFGIDSKERSMSVTYGPETTDKEYHDLSKEFEDYGIVKSGKAGDYKIRMNLVKKNKKLLK